MKDAAATVTLVPTAPAAAAAEGGGVDKSGEWALEALERIKSLKLKPAPQIYELWYRYFQGEPAIVREIDSYSGTLTEEVCVKIYKKHLNNPETDEAVRRISEQVQASIGELAEILGTMRTATTEYGETLDNTSEKIRKIGSIDELGVVVTAIVKDTRKMVQKNQELELQLVNSARQVTELRNNLDNIRKEVLTDSLTGLSNRKAFDEQIQERVSESSRINSPLVVMLLDIDHFKRFNDNFGHQVGDQVLRLVARTLTDNVKGRDIAARYGGEEFGILLPDTPLAAGLKVAESLRRSVETREIINKATNKSLGRITMSIGVAEYVDGESISDLVSRADSALYRAKKAGRNKVIEADVPPKKK